MPEQSYYQAHREEIVAKVRAWKLANPERVRATTARHAETNRARVRAWQLAHPEKVRESRARRAEANHALFQAWRCSHPDRWREICRAAGLRHRARKAQARSEPYDWASIALGGPCGICGEAIDRTLAAPDPLSPSIDHIVPLARGGSDLIANLQPAHLLCNKRKGAA